MQFLTDLAHDMRAALAAGAAEFHRWRWLRRGGCPDQLPF